MIKQRDAIVRAGWKKGLVTLCAGALIAGNLNGQTNESSVLTPATPDHGKLLDLHLQSKDRMFRGKIKILDTWKKISLRFINISTGQDLGTYPDVLENLTAAKPDFKIYQHQDDIFSDEDIKENEKNPALEKQKVTFFKDETDPTLLNFSSIFDDVGVIQVQVIRDGKQIAYGQTKLTTDAEFSSLINTVDKTISEPIPASTNQTKGNVGPAAK